jgi:hypothetical protein
MQHSLLRIGANLAISLHYLLSVGQIPDACHHSCELSTKYLHLGAC